MYLIVATRPTLSDFLSKLVRIATLYVYTSAEEEYARIIISLIDLLRDHLRAESSLQALGTQIFISKSHWNF